MKIEKSVNELLGLHNVLNELSRRKVPFSIALAKNIKIIKPVFEEFEKEKKELIEINAVLDESGKPLGKLLPAVKEGEEQTERIPNPAQFDQIEWTEEDSMQTVLSTLNKMGEEVKETIIYPIDVNREYFDSTSRMKQTIRDFIDRELEANMVLYLDSMGMLKNMYEEDDSEKDNN